MNPFTTIPKFMQGYAAAKKYNSLASEIEDLRNTGRIEEEKEVIRKGQKLFCETIADKYNITFDVKGEENIPTDGSAFMIYSNHQSFADIPAICYAVRNHCQIGFVSKEEWRKYKILRDAVNYTRSIFLDRGNPRAAVKALSDAKEVLDLGFNLAIFPEGTRSKGHEMGEFKAGSFKFAEKAKVPVLPITLDGGYKLFEEKGTYQPCHIDITIHPLVHLEQMDKQEQKEAAEAIEATIKSAL